MLLVHSHSGIFLGLHCSGPSRHYVWDAPLSSIPVPARLTSLCYMYVLKNYNIYIYLFFVCVCVSFCLCVWVGIGVLGYLDLDCYFRTFLLFLVWGSMKSGHVPERGRGFLGVLFLLGRVVERSLIFGATPCIYMVYKTWKPSSLWTPLWEVR